VKDDNYPWIQLTCVVRFHPTALPFQNHGTGDNILKRSVDILHGGGEGGGGEAGGSKSRRRLAVRKGAEFLSAFATLRKVAVSFVMSFLGTTRLPLDGFPSNLIFEYFSKICPKNSSFVKICQE